MATKYVHPLYPQMLDVWKKVKDCYAGEDVIKANGGTYLPPTSGMLLDGYGVHGQSGQKAYEAYVKRSVFPDCFEDAVHSAIGVMHSKPATIEVPDGFANLLNKATDTGEDLQMLLRKINYVQLVTGRLGLLGDIRVVDGAPSPTIVLYHDTSIENWDDVLVDQDSTELRFVMLDETAQELDASTFQWKLQGRHKVVAQIGADGKIALGDNPAVAVGVATLGPDQSPLDVEYAVMGVQGADVTTVPFVFCNATDLSSIPEKPPLLGLANTCLAIYRGEADYRQNLFMQGQDTLVIIGDPQAEDQAIRTGAGANLKLPINGDAKYIGVNSQGLPEQRQALTADYTRAEVKSSKMMTESGQESGEALRVRVSAKTATLNQIAITGAAALQEILRRLAVMFGEDESKVRVIPNLEFAKVSGDGLTLRALMEAKAMGAPLSDKSIHGWAKEQGFTSITFEEELSLIESEGPTLGAETPPEV